ncbi:hypothetical protein [Nocardia sp. XZ_19_369]|uniref:hypothetical protein n=1 Tax=Nocardia sp. XZ_19_369 TaxID=2769487 RepID=UPI00188FFCA9|nr:hypothetical protein [Nocardia sp. XZ_19_369]
MTAKPLFSDVENHVPSVTGDDNAASADIVSTHPAPTPRPPRRCHDRIGVDLLVLTLLLITVVILVGYFHANGYAVAAAGAFVGGGVAVWRKLRQR